MWLKVVIVILFFALVASLSSSFWFLMKDKGGTKRTWHALSVRLAIAVLLLGFIAFGMYTGRLGSKAPWDARHLKGQEKPEQIRSDNVNEQE